MKVNLRLTSGEQSGSEYLVEVAEFTIGRDASCSLALAVNDMSRKHCTLLIRNDGVFLRDDQSSNGTYVDGRRVLGAIQLKDNDELRLGSQELQIEIFGDATVEDEPEEEAKPKAGQTVVFQPPSQEEEDEEDSLDWDVRLKDF